MPIVLVGLTHDSFYPRSSLSFVYVQTILSFVGTLDELSNPVKDKYYSTRFLMIGLPILSVAWLEALACESFLIHYGGHVWFDNTIALSFLAYYCYVRIVEESTPRSKTD